MDPGNTLLEEKEKQQNQLILVQKTNTLSKTKYINEKIKKKKRGVVFNILGFRRNLHSKS